MEVALVLVKADGSSREVKVDRLPLVMGRDASARLRIPAPSVSRKHCELVEDDEELLVRDLGSSNGTFVNGKKIRESELNPGDLLRVGDIVLVVKIDGFPKDVDAKECYTAGSMHDDTRDESLPGAPLRPQASPPIGGGQRDDDGPLDLGSLLGDEDEQ